MPVQNPIPGAVPTPPVAPPIDQNAAENIAGRQQQAAQDSNMAIYGRGLNQLIKSRASYFPDRFWKENPVMATYLLGSHLPENTLRTVSQHWSEVTDWVNGNNTFAGLPGAMTEAYLKTLNIQDPAVRQRSQTTINAFKALSPSEQSSLVAWAQHPDFGKTPTTVLGRDASAQVIKQVGDTPEALAKVLNVDPSEIKVVNGEIQITVPTGGYAPTTEVSQLESMFPALKGKIQFEAGGISFDDLKNSWQDYASELKYNAGMRPGESALDVLHREGVGGLLKTGAEIAGEAGMQELQAVVAPIQAAGWVAGTAEGNLENWLSKSSIPGAASAQHVLSAGINPLTPVNRVVQNFMQDTIGTLGVLCTGTFWQNLAEHLPTTAMGQNQTLVNDESHNLNYINLTGSVLLMFLLHEASTAAAASGVTADMPLKEAAARSGVVLDAEGNVDYSATAKSALSEANTLQKITHPIRYLVDPTVRAAVTDLLGKTPEEWEELVGKNPEEFALVKQPANFFFDRVQAIKDNIGIWDKRAAVYNLGVGADVNPEYVDELLNTPRADMPRVWLDHYYGSTPEEVAAANNRLVNAQFALEDAKAGKAGIGTGTPTASAVEDALVERAAAQAEIDNLHAKDPALVRFPGADFKWNLNSFLHRSLMSGRPMGFMERAVNALFSWDPRALNAVRSLVNKLDQHPFLWDTASKGFDETKADDNARVISRYSQRLNIPQNDIEAIQETFTHAQENSQVVHQVLERFARLRVANAAADTPSGIKALLGRAYENSVNEGWNTIDVTQPDGTVVREPVYSATDINGTKLATPFLPSEFLGQDKLYLPDLDVLEGATKMLRRWELGTSQWKHYAAVSAGFAMEGIKLLGRTTMLPLWAAFRLPSLLIKHEVDPNLGRLSVPGGYEAAGADTQALLKLYDIDPKPENLGQVNEVLQQVDRPYNTYVSTADFIRRGNLTSEGARSLLNRIDSYNNDALAHTLLDNNLDVEKTAQQLESGAWSEYNETKLKAVGITDGATLRAVLTRQAEAIRQASLGVPGLLDYMKTGRFRYPRMTPAETADVEAIRARLDGLDMLADRAAVRTLQEELRVKLNEVYEHTGDSQWTYGDIEDEKARIAELKKAFKANELKLPKEIQVSRYGHAPYRDADGEIVDTGSRLDIAREVNAKLSQITYGVFRPVAATDFAGRKTFFSVEWRRWYEVYKSRGMEGEDAAAKATVQAANFIQDVSYNLSTRSQAEKALKNIFWFAPAQGELMYRWFYALPAEQGSALIGDLLNVAKVENYINMFKAMGVIRPNARGQLSAELPIANFLRTISAGTINLPAGANLEVPLSSLEPLINPTGLLPQAGNIPAIAIGALTNNPLMKYVPLLSALGRKVAPYGVNTPLLPTDLRTFLGAFGIHLSDPLSDDAVSEIYNRHYIQALQLSGAYEVANGHPEPTEAEFRLDADVKGFIPVGSPGRQAAENAYSNAMHSWIDLVANNAGHIAAGTSAISFLLPGSTSITAPGQVDYEKFLSRAMNLTPAQFSYLRDKWLDGHPASVPFSISGGIYTGSRVPAGTSALDLYAKGYKKHMDPAAYNQFYAAMMSKWLYDQRSYQETRGAGKTWTDIIHNWSAHTMSILHRDEDWDLYQQLSTNWASPGGISAKDIIDEHDTAIHQAYGTKQTSAEYQWVKDTLLHMQELAPLFTGESGMPTNEYNTIISNLKSARADLFKEYAQGYQSPDQVTKDLNWYFDKVVGPYMAATEPLWQQVAEAKSHGGDTSSLYQQIDAIKQQYQGLTHNGVAVPTPDEFFYDSKSPHDQMIAKAHYQTEPAGFLSDFQRGIAGYPTFTGQDEMWKAITQNDVQYKASEIGLSTSSSAYKAIETLRTNADTAVAAQYGTSGLQAYQLSTQPPFARLQALGAFPNDTVMQTAFGLAAAANAGIAGGASPTTMQTWLYDWISTQTDPTFKNDMDLLSLGYNSGPGGVHPTGLYLWAEVFFGEPYYFIPAGSKAAVNAG